MTSSDSRISHLIVEKAARAAYGEGPPQWENRHLDDILADREATRRALEAVVDDLRHPDDIPVMRSVWQLWIDELKGPIHAEIMALSGMCSDERPHPEIDEALHHLDDMVRRLRCAIEFPVSRPSEAALERGRQLAKEHGW